MRDAERKARLAEWAGGQAHIRQAPLFLAFIADLSRSLTLLPGTVILTGTPAGVGFTRQPPLFLKAGDRVEVEISSVGTLANHVELE